MLTKREIQLLIDKNDPSLKIVKPVLTPKSSTVWKSFSYIYVNDNKQEYVICHTCSDVLIYKIVTGTSSLLKHIKSCLRTKEKDSTVQTDMRQHYESSTSAPKVPTRIEEEIKTACVEFAALDCRSFQTISGFGFQNLAQKIFDVGRLLPLSRKVNIQHLLPHPITVRSSLFLLILLSFFVVLG